MKFKCLYCNKNTEQIYETERNVFMQCKRDHKVKDKKGKTVDNHFPVFMVAKEVED